jgi:diguanylate cyclase (GGDEF)-like protein/PAS domain S-box-containing protein
VGAQGYRQKGYGPWREGVVAADTPVPYGRNVQRTVREVSGPGAPEGVSVAPGFGAPLTGRRGPRRPLRVTAMRAVARFGDRSGVLLIGLPIVGLFMLLTALDAGGLAAVWENAHWTSASLVGAVLALVTIRSTNGLCRRVAILVATASVAWFLGQIVWDIQTAIGYFQLPAPSDIGFLMVVPPVVVAFVVVIRGRVSKPEELAIYLDTVAIFLAVSAVVLAVYGAQMVDLSTLGEIATVAYPIVHIATAVAGLVTLLAIRAAPRAAGYWLLAGFAILGLAWIDWLRQAVVGVPPVGSLAHYGFSVGILLVGAGGADWQVGTADGRWFRRVSTVVVSGLPLAALLTAASLLVARHVLSTHPLDAVDLAALAVVVVTGIRQALLVHEGGRLLDDSRQARDALEVAMLERAQADSRYQILVERVPAAVYIDVSDAAVSDGGHLSYMSPQIEAILGYPPDAFLDDPELWPRLIHAEDHDRVVAALEEHWVTEQPLRVDYRMIKADGSLVWVHDEAYAIREEMTGGRRVSQGILVDTTEQKRLEAQLVHDAFHDPLTGLANRALFREHLERAVGSNKRRRSAVAVLFLDIDDFKVVNDSLGHAAGDRLLVEVARRLSTVIRSEDVAARQGGDEFTILVGRVDGPAEAMATAHRIAEALARPIDLDGRPLVIGVSIGIALGRGARVVAGDLLAHADAAMYAAKAQGKGRSAVFDPSMRRRAKDRLETESELRGAIETQAFELHYQPIVSLPTGRIVGFEALVRWRHPVRGLTAPGEFIPLAEATGLIVPLGRIVLREACRSLRTWLEAGADPSLTVSVNVSPRQAAEAGFAAEVRGILDETGLAPRALVLEITESLTVEASASTGGSLRELRDLGVQLDIDDFGTGFSALDYFKRFTVQGLKIDRSFVGGLERSREDVAIVTATLAFASALGLTVTAEGVETVEQLDRLIELGCHRAQGFLLSVPVPADQVPALLALRTLRPPAPATTQVA